MHPMNYLFSINNDYACNKVHIIFEPCYNYVCKSIEDLYQRNIKALHVEDKFCGLSLITRNYMREASLIANQNCVRYFCPIHEDFYKEATQLEEFLNKVSRDVRQIQMWFSVCQSEASKEKLPISFFWPQTLKTALSIELDEPYIIPEGKEETWKRIENLINYYLGLKLLL